MSTLAPQPSESQSVLAAFASQSARASIIVPGYPQCPGRLESVSDASVTLRAFDAVFVGRVLSGVSLAVVTVRANQKHGCFFANVRQVTEEGRVVFDLPNHVSTVEQRQSPRKRVPDTMDVHAVLEYPGGTCVVRIRDVSAQGIGVVRADERDPPPANAKVSLVVGHPEPELVIPCTIVFVSDERIGIQVGTEVQSNLLLEFAAFLGRSAAV